MITLVLGGVRSGKSAVAEGLARRHAPSVTYVATMLPADDPELTARISAHRARRDPTWRTVDAGENLAGLLASLSGTVLLDSLGPWVAAAGGQSIDVDVLCHALRTRTGDTVVVSDEVGLAVHPPTAEGRHFCDALGSVNSAISSLADVAFLVVAGRAVLLPRPGVPELPTQ